MKTKAFIKIKKMSNKSLTDKLQKDKKLLVETKMKLAVGKEKNLHQAAKMRHQIAITKTILAENNQPKNKP